MRRLFVALAAALYLAAAPGSAHAGPAIVGYFDLSSGGDPSTVPWQQITHVNLAFAGIDSTGQCNWVNDIFSNNVDTVYNPGQVQQVQSTISALLAARQANNPNVKIMLSVGGAGLSYRFSDAVSTPVGVSTLAWSCWGMAQNLGLDGIDYDWEFPGRYGQPPCPIDSCDDPADNMNFAQLITETRALMGQAPVLSLAVASQETIPSETVRYDYIAIDPALTFWHIMVYELAGSWSNGTQLQAPFSTAVQSLNYWASQPGVTPSKLVLGVPFYSKFWAGVQNDRGLGTPGGSSNNQGVPFSLVHNRCIGNDPAWNCGITTVNDGAYCYCRNQKIWYTYDGPTQMLQKAQYVAAEGYGGVMFWSLPGDTPSFQLTQSIATGFQSSAPPTAASAASVVAIIL